MQKIVVFTFFVMICFVCNNAIAQADSTLPKRFDVIIDEILADPNPVVGLPDAEFVELKNTSGKSINLDGWRLTSSSTGSKPFSSYTLPADSFVIITAAGNINLYANFGKVLGINSFPSLNNNGTALSLMSKEQIAVHSVSYNNTWFQNDVKSNGGYSLEMIDTHNPCTGANNWKASTEIKGGTPGIINSIDGNNPDNIAPALVRAAAIDSVHVIATFSEPVDSAKAAIAANYSISDGVGPPVAAVTISPAFNKALVTLATPLITGKVYTITANNITDCSGNEIHAVKTVRAGLPSVLDSFDIVINEMLFNPKPGAIDYVEIYNRSNKIFNLKDLYAANRSAANAISSMHQLTEEDILIFPGDFFVISENGALVKQNYTAKNPGNFIDVAMPSLPNEDGVVVLLNAQRQVIDELHYSAKWHNTLIDNDEGISLERIDYNKPTQNQENWASAASTAGFGTPSYQNSQSRSDLSVKAAVTVTPKTFSPDNDGFEDFTTINFRMSELGYVANINIFDAAGRPVKALAKNATLALEGSFKWDGLNDRFNKVPAGIYVIYTEIFNHKGKKKSFKNTVIAASKF